LAGLRERLFERVAAVADICQIQGLCDLALRGSGFLCSNGSEELKAGETEDIHLIVSGAHHPEPNEPALLDGSAFPCCDLVRPDDECRIVLLVEHNPTFTVHRPLEDPRFQVPVLSAPQRVSCHDDQVLYEFKSNELPRFIGAIPHTLLPWVYEFVKVV
jgi:hypothetical protein